MWRAKLRRWLPYVIDQALLRQALTSHGKVEPTPWPADDRPTDTSTPVSPQALHRLDAFARRADRLMSKFRKRRG